MWNYLLLSSSNLFLKELRENLDENNEIWNKSNNSDEVTLTFRNEL